MSARGILMLIPCTPVPILLFLGKITRMKHALFLSLLSLCTTTLTAQFMRSMPNSALAPFFHGVASGDPLADRVILWTRLTLQDTLQDALVHWRIATDTGFANILNSGFVVTGPERDYTVKVDADGLEPGTWYYYQFEHAGSRSLTGRTRTLPVGPVSRLRLGVVSCADYQNGYYHAYKDLALRNTVDVVLHLGDYIYEYAANSGMMDRRHEPAFETITVQDYRLRHSLYKLDADLRLLHQQLPMIAVWDDHETANNAWTDGADNHQPTTEGPWSDRKQSGKQAYFEWMPIRDNSVAPGEIYRSFPFGSLLSLHMLDTRLEGRSVQLSADDPNLANPDRTLLSAVQFDWLTTQLEADTALWIALGQQVMMAPLLAFGQVMNTDQWDGYPAQRDRLYNHLRDNNLNNVVVLTGDIHSAWANDLPLSGYSPITGANSAGVEFISNSVTSRKPDAPGGSLTIQALNPHVKYVNVTQHGYLILDVDTVRAQSDFVFVSNIRQPGYTSGNGPSWATLRGTRRLTPSTTAVPPPYPPLAPSLPQIPTAVDQPADLIALTAAPNPFSDLMVLQFALRTPQPVSAQVTDLKGRVVLRQDFDWMEAGIQHVHFNASTLQPGTYIAVLRGRSGSASARMIKIDR